MSGVPSAISFSNKISHELFLRPYSLLSKEERLRVKREGSKNYYFKNKETINKKTKEYAKNHGKERREYYKEYFSRNKDIALKIKNLRPKYRIEEKERCPGRVKFYGIRSSARTRGIELNFSASDFIKWFDSQEKKCIYCKIDEYSLKMIGLKSPQNLLTIDRMDSSRGYSIDNVCICCYRCNTSKSNYITHYEMKEIGLKYLLPKWIKKINLENKNGILS